MFTLNKRIILVKLNKKCLGDNGMIFKLLLKLVKAETEADRLKWSVYYGWGLVATSLVTFIFIESQYNTSPTTNVALMFFIISTMLFSFRYTSVNPFLGAVAGGVSVISIAMLFDNLSSRRDSAASFGAFMGVLAVLIFMIIKNVIVGLYYLIKETIRYVEYKKANQQTELEDTDLGTTL